MQTGQNSIQKAEGRLRPGFTPLGIWAFSIGTSIGWGSFVITCNTYLAQAGILGTLAGLGIGLAVFLLIVRNLQYMMRHNASAGGIYNYTRRVCGHDFGFLTAWFLFLTYIAILWANLTSLPLFARYLVGDIFRFGFHYRIFGYDVYAGEALLSVGAVCLVGLLCAKTRKAPQTLMITLALTFITSLFACLAIALIRRGSGNGFSFEPLMIPDKSEAGQILRIAAISPWAFIGFENVAHFSSEFAFPARKMNRVLILSVVMTTLVYIALTVLSVTAYPPAYDSWLAYIRDLGNLNGLEGLPAFYAARHYLGDAGVTILFIALFAVILTSLIGNLMTLSRLLYALGRNQLLPEKLAKVNGHGEPENGIWTVVILSCLIPLMGRTAIGWVVDVTTLGATMIYGLMSWAVFKEAGKNGDRFDRTTGAAGTALMIGFAALLLLPSLVNLDAMANESYILFTAWAILGLLFFRRIMNRDRDRNYGRSIIVWLILLLLIMFTALAWMTEQNTATTQGILGEIRDYYHAQAGGAGLEQDAAFIQEQSNQIHDLNLRTTLVLCGLFLFAVGVMLNNFLSAQRREKEDNILLSSVRQAANTDPLTGVKSKHAYVQAEESLDQRIAEKMTEGFAIAVCDVNDLKKVNDTQGHKAGDEYIRSACAMICKQYKHSPVYRIGGDEFVVILEGSDYSERHRLLAEINQQSEINQREGGPVVSVGVSDFIPEQDISVQQVFERADEVMYARKKYLKAQFPSYR